MISHVLVSKLSFSQPFLTIFARHAVHECFLKPIPLFSSTSLQTLSAVPRPSISTNASKINTSYDLCPRRRRFSGSYRTQAASNSAWCISISSTRSMRCSLRTALPALSLLVYIPIRLLDRLKYRRHIVFLLLSRKTPHQLADSCSTIRSEETFSDTNFLISWTALA